MSKKNKYEKKAAKKSLLDGISHETKEKLTYSGVETLKDIAIGIVGGGLTAAVIGNGVVSIIAGAVLTGAGHYTKRKLLSTFGIGLMASSSFKNTEPQKTPPPDQTTQGVENKTMLEGIKDRVLAFKDSLAEKVMLDKVLKKKSDSNESMGETQYFTYPEDSTKQLNEGKENIDLSSMEDLEKQIAEHAGQYVKKNKTMGILPNENGMGELD